MSDHEPTSRTTRTVPLAYPAERVGPRCLNDPATTWLGASGHGMGWDSIENTMATSSQAHLVHRSLNIQQRIHPDQEETRQAGGIDSKPSHTQGIESHRPSPDTPTPRGHLSCRTQHDSEIDRLAPAAVVYRPRRWPCQRRHRMRQVRDSVRCSLLPSHLHVPVLVLVQLRRRGMWTVLHCYPARLPPQLPYSRNADLFSCGSLGF
jgi:hypothetical protein